MMRRQQHGMLEWLDRTIEYGDAIPDVIYSSITRALRSGSETVVFYGHEFNPSSDCWDDVIRFIESIILGERQ